MTDDENEIEIELVDELPSRLADADEVVVAMRVEDLERSVPGSMSAPCFECGRAVWLSPASQLMLHHHDWPVACITCVLELIEAEADDAPG